MNRFPQSQLDHQLQKYNKIIVIVNNTFLIMIIKLEKSFIFTKIHFEPYFVIHITQVNVL